MAEVNIYPWANDEAADWFHRFWESKDIKLVIDTIENFNLQDEEYDSVRAACHVLYCFGSAYAFPVDLIDLRKPTIEKGISILERMINPPSDEWNYLESWGGNKNLINEVKREIEQLKFILTQ